MLNFSSHLNIDELIFFYFSLIYFDCFAFDLHKCNLDECDKCLTKFINSVKHEYVIIDGGIRKSFCRAQCMNAHVRQDTNIVVCCNCQHRQQYYSSIRRSCDKRCFCSIHCAIAGETGIEQLVQNDERSYLAILNLKCSTYDSELKSNESFEGKELNFAYTFEMILQIEIK